MKLRQAGFVALCLAIPGRAEAHGGLPGGGGFVSGVAHPMLAIEQLMILLAFGVLLGRNRGQASLPLLLLAAALVSGLWSGVALAVPQALALALALGLGVCLAAAVQPPIWARAVLAGLAGWIIGTNTDVPALASNDLVEVFAPYVGVFTGVFLVTLNAAALASLAVASKARRPAAEIALRVLGSWIAAIAIMVLALRLTNGGGA